MERSLETHSKTRKPFSCIMSHKSTSFLSIPSFSARNYSVNDTLNPQVWEKKRKGKIVQQCQTSIQSRKRTTNSTRFMGKIKINRIIHSTILKGITRIQAQNCITSKARKENSSKLKDRDKVEVTIGLSADPWNFKVYGD